MSQTNISPSNAASNDYQNQLYPTAQSISNYKSGGNIINIQGHDDTRNMDSNLNTIQYHDM